MRESLHQPEEEHAGHEDPLAQGSVATSFHQQIEMITTPFRRLSPTPVSDASNSHSAGTASLLAHDGMMNGNGRVVQAITNNTLGSGPDEEMNPLVLESPSSFASDTSESKHDDGHGGGAPGSASNPQVVINIIISFVGAGLLGVPNAFSKAGWLLGSVTCIVISALNLYAMLLLPQVKRKLLSRSIATTAEVNSNGQQPQQPPQSLHSPKDIVSYGDLGRVILGPTGEVLVNICLGISQAGFATAYIIFIAANLYSVARIPRLLVCILSVPGLSFLVSLNEMKQLAPFSLLANAANFSALLAVLVQDFGELRQQRKQRSLSPSYQFQDPAANISTGVDDDLSNFTPESNTQPPTIHAVRWGGFLYAIAITIYSMEGIGLILSLEASAKQPHMFLPLLKGTVGCITMFMAFFGSVGYMAFGDDTMAPITLNLTGAVVGTFVKCALSLGLYLTYPIMMFPIWSIAERISPKIKDNAKLSKRFRIGVVCVSALVAYAVPDFGKFLSLVGSSICTILGFILPCYFHWVVFDKELPKWQYNLNVFLIFGGSLFGIIGTAESFIAMLKGDLESEVRRLEEL